VSQADDILDSIEAKADRLAAVAYAAALGEAIAVFYQSMITNGLPEPIARFAVEGYVIEKFRTVELEADDYEEEEDEDD